MLFLRTSSLQGEKILFSLKLMLLKMFFPLLRKLFCPPALSCCLLVLQGRRTPCTTMAKNITSTTSTTTLIALICFFFTNSALGYPASGCIEPHAALLPFQHFSQIMTDWTGKLFPNLYFVFFVTCHRSTIWSEAALARTMRLLDRHQETTSEAPALSQASTVLDSGGVTHYTWSGEATSC